MRRLLGGLVALALVASGCTGDDGPGPDQARLEVDGAATVTTAQGEVREETDGTTLGLGDTVVVDDGTAVLTYANGATYELAGAEVVVAATPELTRGRVLVTGGYPAAVQVGTATLTAQGALAVDADEALATAYAGRTRITGLGDLGELLGLRSVTLSAVATPVPVVYDPQDDWDRRFLGDAVAFGDRLEALARGYTSNLRSATPPASFFESVIPGLRTEREFNTDLLVPERPPGEVLVGAAIAVQGRSGTFRERWEAVFGFRDQGAAWGLVALDQGVSAAPVLDTIELAIEAPAPTTTRPTTPTVPSTSTTEPGAGTSSTTSPTITSTTSTTAPGGLLGPILDPVEDILGDLLAALGLGR